MTNNPLEKNVRLIARHLYLPQASAKRRWPEIDALVGKLLMKSATLTSNEPVLVELRALLSSKSHFNRRRDDLFEIIMDRSYLLSQETALYKVVLDFLSALYLELGSQQQAQKRVLEQLRTDAASSHPFRREIALKLLKMERPTREEVYYLQDMRQKADVHNALVERIVKFPDSFYEHHDALFAYIVKAGQTNDQERMAQIGRSGSLIPNHIAKAGSITGKSLFTSLYRYYQDYYYENPQVKGLFLKIITKLGDSIVATIGEIYQQDIANRLPALDVLGKLIGKKSGVAMDKLFEIVLTANNTTELQTLATFLQKTFWRLFNTTDHHSLFASHAQSRLEQLLMEDKPELIPYNPRLNELLNVPTQLDPHHAARDIANDIASREDRNHYRFGGLPLAEALTDIVCDFAYPEEMRINAANFIPRLYHIRARQRQLPKLREAYLNTNELFLQLELLEVLAACNNNERDIELTNCLTKQREQPELRPLIDKLWNRLVPGRGVISYRDDDES
jgi:hypothetical protein